MLYKKGGRHIGPAGNSYTYIGVDNEESLKELLANGWFATLEEAVATSKPAPVKVEPEATVEVRQYKDLSDDEKKEIGRRILNGDKHGDIGKEYNVHHFTVGKVKRELD